MKKFNLYDIYELGQRVAYLESLDQHTKIAEVAFDIFRARSSLGEMASDLSPLLPTARRAASKVIHDINMVFSSDIKELFSVDKQKTVGLFAGIIKSSKTELETVLRNDMPGIASYLVSQKGIYRTEDLILRADYSFPAEIRKDIPAQASKDYIEAGKCLAYEVPTACAFHLWRAVETVMGAYYQKLTGKTLIDDGVTRNWAAYIKALETKNADKKITQFLDHVRNEYRNPHAHPEEMLELNEALGLFGVATGVIHQMILAIQKP